MNKTICNILSCCLLFVIFAGNVVIGTYVNKNNNQSIQTIAQIENDIKLPVIMYHQVLTDETRKNDYVITKSQFESDLSYLKNNGYTPILVDDLLRYINEDKKLPKKPIMITFDDGYKTFYSYVYPLLEKYNCKAVLSIIGKYTDLYSSNKTDNISYSHVTWDDLRELISSNIVEVANHTYDLHYNQNDKRKGIKKLYNENQEQYKNLLNDNIKNFNNKLTKELDIVNYTFTYPFGFHTKESDSILKEFGFKVLLNCEEKVNYINKEKIKENGIISLCRFNRSSKYETQQFFEKIEK